MPFGRWIPFPWWLVVVSARDFGGSSGVVAAGSRPIILH